MNVDVIIGSDGQDGPQDGFDESSMGKRSRMKRSNQKNARQSRREDDDFRFQKAIENMEVHSGEETSRDSNVLPFPSVGPEEMNSDDGLGDPFSSKEDRPRQSRSEWKDKREDEEKVPPIPPGPTEQFINNALPKVAAGIGTILGTAVLGFVVNAFFGKPR